MKANKLTHSYADMHDKDFDKAMGFNENAGCTTVDRGFHASDIEGPIPFVGKRIPGLHYEGIPGPSILKNRTQDPEEPVEFHRFLNCPVRTNRDPIDGELNLRIRALSPTSEERHKESEITFQRGTLSDAWVKDTASNQPERDVPYWPDQPIDSLSEQWQEYVELYTEMAYLQDPSGCLEDPEAEWLELYKSKVQLEQDQGPGPLSPETVENIPTVEFGHSEEQTKEATIERILESQQSEEHIEIENYNVSSLPAPDQMEMLLRLLHCTPPEGTKEPLMWSIMTDCVHYTTDVSSSGDYIHTQNNRDENRKLFNPDNCNIPRESPVLSEENSQDPEGCLTAKEEHFLSANENRPHPEESGSNHLDDRYPSVVHLTNQGYAPEVDVCATYLWSDTEAESSPSGAKYFENGHFPITRKSLCMGSLMDKSPVKVLTLLDSGASKPMIRRKFYEEHDILKTYPTYQIAKQPILAANGGVMMVDTAVKFMIEFSGHYFEFIAYIIDMLDDVDFLVGYKAFGELEVDLQYSLMRMTFPKRSVCVYTDQRYVIPPGTTVNLNYTVVNMPASFTGGNVIVKLDTGRANKLLQTLSLRIDADHILRTSFKNTGNDPVVFQEGHKMGIADLRSAGYYFHSREGMEYSLSMYDMAEFLTEDESKDMIAQALQTTRIHQKEEQTPPDEVDPQDMESWNIDPEDPYPWLEPDDPRRSMTDEEILDDTIDLDESCLSKKGKAKFMNVIYGMKEAFSLRNEIGLCPHMEVELELKDKSPFFIRPFPIKEEKKKFVEKEMRKGVLLGILKKGMSSYSSPIMLIPRKNSEIPRIITDFRHLNTRLVKLNPSIPLVKDAIQMLGASECEVISVVDLRDAYHTLRLSPESQKYCGITPFYGSPTYLYQRLGMGLSVSPAIWQNFINKVLDEIPTRQHHLAIMDDCLIHSKLKEHIQELIYLFETIIRNGLKISPKKCQFFREKLTYMGHYHQGWGTTHYGSQD